MRSELKAKAIRAIHDSLVDPVNRVIDATCPVYEADGRGNPLLVGSALAVAIGSSRFLLTAAHVMDRIARASLEFGGADSIVDLPGVFYHSRIPAEGRAADRVDVAVKPLTAAHVASLGALRYIEADELAPHAVPDLRPVVRSKYLALGYAKTMQPRQPTNRELKAVPLRTVTYAADEDAYRRLGISFETHLALHFDRTDFADPRGPISMLPDPHGMSGCGLWLLEGFGDFAKSRMNARLVAISTEFHERESVMVGTRVGVLLKLINEIDPAARAVLAEMEIEIAAKRGR